jgi:DNA-binding XRE family transcriptional regulator
MASINIDSGDFKLLRNINIDHQPSRAKVVNEWLRAFDSEVPRALNALADVIEDVYSFPIIWEERRKNSPEEFFESLGITGLNLDDPARLIKTLRGELGETAKADALSLVKLKKYERDVKIHELRDQGLTQQTIADEVGLTKQRVGQISKEKPVMTEKILQHPRVRACYQINSGTKPSTAARRIREVFGDEFATELSTYLLEKNQ